MKLVRVAVVVALLLVSACGNRPSTRPDADPTTETDRTVAVRTAAGERTALVHRPPSVRAAAPLVVVLHGGAGSGRQAQAAYGWQTAADRGGFVVAYPDGEGRTWNAGACCGTAQRRDVDDVGFLDALVSELVRTEGVDPAQVYATGISNGGMMTYVWACRGSVRLAGIGVVAGSLTSACPTPAPVNLIVVHGTADQNVPIGGGAGTEGVTGTTHTPLTEAVSRFRTADRCRADPTTDADPPITVTRWACAGNRHVVQAIVEGFDHGWPGSAREQAGSAGGWDATEFLVANLRPGGISPR